MQRIQHYYLFLSLINLLYGCEGVKVDRRGSLVSLSKEDLEAFVSQAHEAMINRFYVLEPNLHKQGVSQSRSSAAWYMSATHTPRRSSKNITQVALMAEETTKYMAHALGVIAEDLTGLEAKGTALVEMCLRHRSKDTWCAPKRYRSLSGHCNNVQRPWSGAASTPYARFLPPAYADSISLPRGTALYPHGIVSARDVSLTIHKQMEREHSHLAAMAPIWAQFVAHDLALTPQMTGYRGERLKCCGVEFSEFHPECFPIRLPKADPVHRGSPCQEYTRSASAPRKDCALGPREQMNEVTSFLDLSSVYGSSAEENEPLRQWVGGLLKTQPKLNLLPPDVNTTDCAPHPQLSCFKTGDRRANEHEGLAVLHTIWVREHNRVARILAQLNAHWPEEVVFQETRKILVAQLQHITYTEFLPLIIGQERMESGELKLERDGFFYGYSTDVDASIANSVATTALNFAISLMPTKLNFYDQDGKEKGSDALGDNFFAPFRLYENTGVDDVTASMLNTPSSSNNQHINSLFTDHMYQRPTKEGSGLDLVAQIIQQGRDHGIPGYTQWRKFCALPARSYEDLTNDIPPETIHALKSIYKDVHEVDLLSGALSERVPLGATVGPTLACLLTKQFSALRRGDRHWFENDLPGGFNAAQLSTIRRSTSLALLICRNTRLVQIQPNAFLRSDRFLNAPMLCEGGPFQELDLTHWKENKPLIHIPQDVLVNSLMSAQNDVTDILKQEWKLYQQNKLADPHSPVGTAFGFSRPKRQAAMISNTSLMLEFASQRIIRSFLQGELQDVEGSVTGLVARLPYVELPLGSVVGSTGDLIIADPTISDCIETALPCDHTAKYRSHSGWCNNLQNPHYGQSFRPFNRLLPPRYQDGLGAPRSLGVLGAPLPSPRLISTRIHSDSSFPHTRYSLMLMQFAQITDHDLTFTPVNKGFVGEGILNCGACDSPVTVHPQCFPIEIPDSDPYFPSRDEQGKKLCIPATRSMPGQLSLGRREQMNQLTGYLDMSFVYGSDVCEANILRTLYGGRMNTTRGKIQAKPLLPQTASNPECRTPSGICFNAGDNRASEQPALGSLHTLWLREHNRVARELSSLNPHWRDQTLYQETRRILSSLYQHIAFNEFLPRVLGWDAINKYGLDLLQQGYYNGYDPTCDVTIMNEFSSAAFRFGHSLLRPHFRRVTPDFVQKEPPVRLRDHFFNPQILYQPSMIDDLILGLIDTPMETLDNFITKEVTEHLFENKSIPFSGMDLIALNIQRSRDHGVGGYTRYREACGLPRPASFQDLRDTTHPDQITRLAEVYQHVDDIDLFPGAMSEGPLRGGVLGPTFACIVAKQFNKIRNCDRFWYENNNEYTRFTPTQLAEIRKGSLAKIICNNLDHVKTVQRSVLDLPDPFQNPRVKCKHLKGPDLTAWRERASCAVVPASPKSHPRIIDLGQTQNVSPCVTCTCTREGHVCQSIKIRNCMGLLASYNSDEIAADMVCMVQCLYIFKAEKELTEKNETHRNLIR